MKKGVAFTSISAAMANAYTNLWVFKDKLAGSSETKS
jgi:hypothetical protein